MGRGTCFVLHFPVVAREDDALAPVAARSKRNECPHALNADYGDQSRKWTRKYLIVEDEAGLVTALRDRLRKEGYEVERRERWLRGI